MKFTFTINEKETNKKTTNKKTNKDYQEEIKAKLLAMIDSGQVLPWDKPWRPLNIEGAHRFVPHNVITKKPYQGINRILLMGNPYQVHEYGTYKQWAEKHPEFSHWEGRKAIDTSGEPLKVIQEGQKAHEVYFYKKVVFTKTEEVDGEEVENGVPFFFMRSYSIFNREQTTLPPGEVPAFPEDMQKFSQDSANEIVEGWEVPIFHDQSDRAYYSVTDDEIHIPPSQQFDTPEDYFGTLFHEMAHSTGTRLGRDMRGKFGSKEYAKEELVAEFSSALLLASCGKENTQRNSAYIISWRKKIYDATGKDLISAISQADKAVNLITHYQMETV